MDFKHTILCDDPSIYYIDDFLSTDECDHIINIGTHLGYQKSKVFSVTGTNFLRKRTSQTCWIQHNHDHVIQNVCNRIAQIVGYPLDNAEAMQLVHYDKGGHFTDHYDGWKNISQYKKYFENGGQRMITSLVYLNDRFDGGHTKFTYNNIIAKPKKGRLLIFHNTINGTNQLHPLSKHCGMPVIGGHKYIFNLWFREKNIK